MNRLYSERRGQEKTLKREKKERRGRLKE